MYILNNRRFSTVSENAKYSDLVVKFLTSEEEYGSKESQFIREAIPKELETEFNGDAFITKLTNFENDKQWKFLMVNDRDYGWYASNLKYGIVTKNDVINYRRARGEEVVTAEDYLVNEIKSILTFYLDDCEVIDSRHRLLDKSQKNQYTTKITKEAMHYFYDMVVMENRPRNNVSHVYPDLLIRREKQGRNVVEFVELERSRYEKERFWIKLFKLHGSGKLVYFILEDKHYRHHVKLIKEFEVATGRKFKKVMVCKLSEFKMSGPEVLRDIKYV